MGLFSYIFASDNARNIKKLNKIEKEIETYFAEYELKTDEEMQNCTKYFREKLKNGETLKDLLPEVFAAVREAIKRVLNKTAYRVQLLGGIALFQGRIAEMKTGEGKTITEAFPAYLQALDGNGVHIVTVNEYLAKRDAEWIGKIYRYLGMTVGCTLANTSPDIKRKAYACDITYGTNNEFGFDYLRDNMVRRSVDRVQRGHHFAIVDEVDSILIDEARTPLIISGRATKSNDNYLKASKFAKSLKNTDYIIDEKEKQIRLEESGIAKAERYYGIANLSDIENIELNHYINNALRAQYIMKRDNNYIVKDDEVVIVDEFTGRLMDGRKYSDGLHQAIEAKEGVTIKDESQTMATITFQNYFRLYKKLSGMTGTAKTEETEFNKIYNLDVVTIPTNLPVVRKDHNDIVYSTENAKFRNIVEEVKRVHETGRPVLVGTITIEKSEKISDALKKAKIKHNVLNAKNHELESEIIAQAGRKDMVTIATNMAGRGTDILLGGNPEFMTKKKMKELGYTDESIEFATSFILNGSEEMIEAKNKYQELLKEYTKETDAEKEEVKKLGGLHIIGTERHESRRIDNQLRGRAGRQGDPGSSVFFVSLEDELVRRFGGDKVQSLVNFFKIDEDTPFQVKMLTNTIETAQKRIEGINFSARQQVLRFDNVLNEQRELIYKERNRVIDGANIHNEVIDMVNELATSIVFDHLDENQGEEEWDLAELNKALEKVLPGETNFLDLDMVEGKEVEEIADLASQEAIQRYEDKLEQFRDDFGIDMSIIERDVLIRHVDMSWMQHIDYMDILRREIGLRAHGQHDPIIAYKEEGYNAFEKMVEKIRQDVSLFLLNLHIEKPVIVRQPKPIIVESPSASSPEKVKTTANRNDLCPCGSGKKYKQCCGK